MENPQFTRLAEEEPMSAYEGLTNGHVDCRTDIFSQFVLDPSCFEPECSTLVDPHDLDDTTGFDFLSDPKIAEHHGHEILDAVPPFDPRLHAWSDHPTLVPTLPGPQLACQPVLYPLQSSPWVLYPQNFEFAAPAPSEAATHSMPAHFVARPESLTSSRSSFDASFLDPSANFSSSVPTGDLCLGCRSKSLPTPSLNYFEQDQTPLPPQIRSTTTPVAVPFYGQTSDSVSLPPLSPTSPRPRCLRSPSTISASSTPRSPPPSLQPCKKRKRDDEAQQQHEGRAIGDGARQAAATLAAAVKTKAMKDGGHNCYSGSQWEGPEIWTPDKMVVQSKPKKRKMAIKRPRRGVVASGGRGGGGAAAATT